jgi:NitT/TauT family transport system permease protein
VGPREGHIDDPVAEAPGGWQAMASLGAGGALWHVAATHIDRFPLPAPVDVGRAAMVLVREARLLEALATSIMGLVAGFTAAVIVGLAAGLLIGRSRTLEQMTDVYLDAIMAAPTLIYVPVLFAIFGVTHATQTAVVFLYAVFVIIETTSAGVRTVDPRLIDMARTLGASESQIFARIVLPAAAPSVLTGLSLGVTRAVKGMVVGEMVVALSGLGAILRGRGARFDLDGVLAILLVVVVVSTVCNIGVQMIGRRALPRVR